jgi:predicted dehydrogenase
MTARVALVGCGWWPTAYHLPVLRDHPQAEIAALVDVDAGRLEAAAAAFGVAHGFASVEDLLAGDVAVDAAIVAVPHARHFAIARLLLDRGVHVLLEKPMVLEPAHGRALLDVAHARGVALLVDYPWHYNTHVLAVRDAVAGGRIGAVEHVSCLYASSVRPLYAGDSEAYRALWGFPVNAPGTTTYSDPGLAGGGQGQTQITHAAALLELLTAMRPASVFAYAASFELAVDLADAVALRYPSGAIGTISSTGAILPGQDELVRVELVGRAGHIQLDVNAGTASIHDADGVQQLPPLPPDRRNPEAAPVLDLIDTVHGRGTQQSTGELGQGAVELVTAIYRSAAAGRPAALVEA